jgi:hypothetical protein
LILVRNSPFAFSAIPGNCKQLSNPADETKKPVLHYLNPNSVTIKPNKYTFDLSCNCEARQPNVSETQSNENPQQIN